MPPEVADAALARGKTIAAEAFGLLSSNLLQAIQQYGVSNALPYCSAQAIPLTSLVARTNDVVLRRVSHKTRNPANQANEAELALIRKLQQQLEGGKGVQPSVQITAPGVVTFYGPIVITNRLCLRCHGVLETDVALDDYVLIKRLYPADAATGFQLGDVRGLWRVDFRALAVGSEPPPPVREESSRRSTSGEPR